jgi:hypothetical protein
MQSSNRIKSHQRPNSKDVRKNKGKRKPVAQRAARSRRQALKRSLNLI